MEFPDLGRNCSASMCNRLDFLPMKCDACGKILCKDHIQYASHQCEQGYQKNKQVPICPLCNQPVPLRPGEPPDVGVGEHIDRDCRSDPALAKRKVYTNRCSMKGCKQMEMVPISCSQCRRNFCLKHRHTQDHNCRGYVSSVRANGLNAALQRQQQASRKAVPGNDLLSSVQGSLTEDEALALAMQQSLADEDAISRSGQWQAGQALGAALSDRQRRNTKSCIVS